MTIPLRLKYRDPDNIPVRSNGKVTSRCERPRKPKHLHLWLKTEKNRKGKKASA